jgi:hypothetical protein
VLRALLFAAALSSLQSFLFVHAQEPGQQNQAIPEPVSSAPFPLPTSPRSKTYIRLVRHGCFGACPIYEVTIWGNGWVSYTGNEFVRVRGKAREKISRRAVDSLLRKVNESEFFPLQIHQSSRCITDVPTASVEVGEPGRQRQIEDECIQEPIDELESAIDETVDIQQWVFIRAKELQKQIDGGWDLAEHGKRYAREAVLWDDPEVIKVLVDNGVPVDTQNGDGDTLLLQAVLDNRYKSAKVLLELGANPGIRDNDGTAPSQNAANRSIEMCKLFLTHGAGIDDQDGMGETMLMNAASSPGNLEIVKFLVGSGATLNVRNHNGKTAMGLAQQMRKQFQESMDLTSVPNYPLFLGDPQTARARYATTLHQYEEVVEYLRQHGGIE